MKQMRKKILLIILIIFSFIQIICIKNLESVNTKKDDLKKSKEIIKKNNKEITEVVYELKKEKEINILEAEEVEGRYNIKVKIEGDKEKILEDLLLLTSYNINRYKITHNLNNNSLILEITY